MPMPVGKEVKGFIRHRQIKHAKANSVYIRRKWTKMIRQTIEQKQPQSQ